MKELGKTKETLRIAIPAILESLVSVVVTSVDTKMLSSLGKEAVSAISFTSQPKLIVFAIFYALGTTTSMLVAQALGKKDRDGANAVFHLTLKATIVGSLVLGALTWALADPIMHLCNQQADTVDMSITFFRIIMPLMIFQNVSILFNAALRGIGETRVPLVSSIVMSLTDILFNYLLIEGNMGFPRLEVAGDAIATVAGTVAACAVSGAYLMKSDAFLSLRGFFSWSGREKQLIGEVSSNASKIVAENLLQRVGFLLSSIIVSTLDSSETAVYSVAMILLNYTFAFGDGLQVAAVTLIGRNMGAQEFDELRAYARVLRVLGLLVSGALGLIYIFGARWYFGLYFPDAEAISQGVSYSYVVVVLTFMQIPRIVNIGIMRGIGDVKTPMMLASLCVFLVNPGVSYLLVVVMSFGIWGVWGGSLASQGLWFVGAVVKTRKLLASLDSAA